MLLSGETEGKGVGGNGVLVGIAFVLIAAGVSTTSIFVQDTRINNRMRFKIRFIEIHFGVDQLAGETTETRSLTLQSTTNYRLRRSIP